MAKYLLMDTETGGVIPNEHSLLSIALGIWENGTIRDCKEWFIEHPVYHITKGAMQINNITLNDLFRKAQPIKDVLFEISVYLNRHFTEKAIPLGHNVAFDMNYIKLFFLDNKNYEWVKKVYYQSVDTCTLMKVVHQLGLVDRELKGLQDAAEYFKIDVGTAHSAIDDIKTTGLVFNALSNLIKNTYEKQETYNV